MSKYKINHDSISEEQKIAGVVIERTNYLEYLIKKVITSYIDSRNNNDFIKDVLLNNEIIPLGAKLKLLFFICDKAGAPIGKEDRNMLHRILSIRNAFAHNDTVTENISVNITKDNKISATGPYINLESLSSSGVFIKTRREDALYEFLDKSEKAQKLLDALVDKLCEKESK